MNKTALVPIADGIEEIETACIIDVLRRADIDVTVASVGAIQVQASRGVKLIADKPIKDCKRDQFDLIALPGGAHGAENLRDCEDLIAMLKAQAKAQRFFGAICASPAIVFAHHGLLDQKKATSYPSYQHLLPDSSKAHLRVVVDEHCITSQGPGTAIEFALTLVEVLLGDERANQIRRDLIAGEDT